MFAFYLSGMLIKLEAVSSSLKFWWYKVTFMASVCISVLTVNEISCEEITKGI